MFKRMKLGAKLSLGFGIVLAFAAFVSWIGYSGVIGVGERAKKAEGTNSLVYYILKCRQSEKNFILRGDDKYIQEVEERSEELIKRAQETKALFVDDYNRKEMDTIIELTRGYQSGFKEYVAATRSGADAARLKAVEEKMIGFARNVESEAAKTYKDQDEKMMAEIASSSTWALIGGAIALLAGIAAAWLITRMIVSSLARAKEAAEHIAVGDLSHDLRADTADEIGEMIDSMQRMTLNLREIVGKVREASGAITNAAREIAQGNSDLSQRTEEQASSLEETASSMEELTGTVRQNTDSAVQANQLARETWQQAEAGGEVVNRAVSAMGEINSASKRIAEISGIIDEIAFQTNLLALNAAVEAARAGEQGRGFAVVAGEVRALAQRTSAAAKEITVLIRESVAQVDNGSRLVNASGESLGEIIHSVKKVADLVGEIAAASREQAAGIEQVSKAVMQMDQVTQQNAALVEEAAAASKSLEAQAVALDDQMAFFKTTRR